MPPRPISPSMVYALPSASARRAGSGWLLGCVMPGRGPELAEGAGAAWRESVGAEGEGLGWSRKSWCWAYWGAESPVSDLRVLQCPVEFPPAGETSIHTADRMAASTDKRLQVGNR